MIKQGFLDCHVVKDLGVREEGNVRGPLGSEVRSKFLCEDAGDEGGSETEEQHL